MTEEPRRETLEIDPFELPVHQTVDVLPVLSPDELQALAEDIKANIAFDRSPEATLKALAHRLSDRALKQDRHDDTYSWEQATDYVNTRAAVGANNPGTTQKINKMIFGVEDYRGPGKSFLSHAWRLYETWPEVFVLGQKNHLPYRTYKDIANSRVPNKDELRRWAESTHPSQAALRQAIKEATQDNQARMGFRLMTTNHWKFPSADGADTSGFDGGICDDLVAYLLHYFTKAGDVVVDPMAGSGRTGRVVQTVRYFHPDWIDTEDYDQGGPRTVLMSDIKPTHPGIVQADARIQIPFEKADFILLDPPYWQICKGKYPSLGGSLEEWTDGLRAIALNCRHLLKPEGCVALILDEFLRSQYKVALVSRGEEVLKQAGFSHVMRIYNAYNNACATMGPLQQWRAMKAHLLVNGMKVINIFTLDQRSQ